MWRIFLRCLFSASSSRLVNAWIFRPNGGRGEKNIKTEDRFQGIGIIIMFIEKLIRTNGIKFGIEHKKKK